MNGIQYVVDEKGRKVAVQIDLKKYGALWEDFWDGLDLRVPPQGKKHSLGANEGRTVETFRLASVRCCYL